MSETTEAPSDGARAPDHGPPLRQRRVRARSKIVQDRIDKRTKAWRTAEHAARAGIAAAPAPVDDRAAPIRGDADEERVTRKTRGERQTNSFDVPRHLRKPGMDYQWWPMTIMGQPVDGSAFVDIHEGGWRPVRPADVPGMMPPDHIGHTVDRKGQRLYCRPMHLTMEARDEDYQAAEQLKRDRIQSALEGRPTGGEQLAGVRGVRPVPLEFEVHGEMGSYSSDPLKRAG